MHLNTPSTFQSKPIQINAYKASVPKIVAVSAAVQALIAFVKDKLIASIVKTKNATKDKMYSTLEMI